MIVSRDRAKRRSPGGGIEVGVWFSEAEARALFKLADHLVGADANVDTARRITGSTPTLKAALRALIRLNAAIQAPR
jgi:hypothetical protein